MRGINAHRSGKFGDPTNFRFRAIGEEYRGGGGGSAPLPTGRGLIRLHSKALIKVIGRSDGTEFITFS